MLQCLQAPTVGFHRTSTMCRQGTFHAHRSTNLTWAPRKCGIQTFRVRPRKSVVTMGLFGLGLPEIAVIAGVAALIWGPSKLPEIGKSLGQTVKNFQVAAKEFNEELQKASVDSSEEVKNVEQSKPSEPVQKK